MISIFSYFRNPTTGDQKARTGAQAVAAHDLLERVNSLVDEAVAMGVFERKADPDTGTEISGAKGGSGAGGFRLPDEGPTPHSSHKEAKAVDVYDPENRLDTWLDTFEDGHGGNSKLAEHDLYREHPGATGGWAHLTTRAPGSGHRTFQP